VQNRKTTDQNQPNRVTPTFGRPHRHRFSAWFEVSQMIAQERMVRV
jgi:hypothetical protein